MKATLTIEVDDLAELARVLGALTGPQPAAGAPTITWTAPTLATPPVSSVRSPAPSPPPVPRRHGPEPSAVRRVLTALYDLGGGVSDPNGHAVSPLAATIGISITHCSKTLKKADHDGLVTRDVVGKKTKRIALTDAGYEAIGKTRRAPATSKPDLSTPRVVEVLEEDDAPLVFKTREQRQQEIRDAQADVQYPRGEP